MGYARFDMGGTGCCGEFYCAAIRLRGRRRRRRGGWWKEFSKEFVGVQLVGWGVGADDADNRLGGYGGDLLADVNGGGGVADHDGFGVVVGS